MKEEIENTIDSQEKEIDLMELAGKLWAQRKLIIRYGIIGLIVGLIIAFSIPKEYSSSITLAPEIGDSKAGSGGLSSLASLAGINLSSAGGGADAVYPQLYPDVVSSIPFITGLFTVPVTTTDGEVMTVEEFMEDKTKSPWWGVVLSLPGKAIGGIMSIFRDNEETVPGDTINPFRLTKDEDLMVQALSKRIDASVDTKTSVITISTTMQDPLVSALLTDTVVSRLQKYVTEYRTNKARKDMEYLQRINDEARDEYYAAQQRYADYMDKNQGITLRSGLTEQERLQNETSLAFDLYNATAQQLQRAKVKVQEITPVYTIVKPATVPIKPSKPSKVMILIGFIFLSVVIASVWILYGKNTLNSLKKIKTENE